MANYSGAGHSRRDEVARAKGFASYYAYRTAPKPQRDAANAAYEARSASYRRSGGRRQSETAATSKTRTRRVVRLGAHREAIDSMRNRELYAFVKRAARAGVQRRNAARVVIYATLTIECQRCVRPDGTTGPRIEVHRLWANYGYAASHLLAALADYVPEPGKPADVVAYLRDALKDFAQNAEHASEVCNGCRGFIIVRVQMNAETKSTPQERAA